MEQRLQRLMRMIGNRAARGRMSATLENRSGFPTRGVVMATGEYLPDASAFSSANNRTLTVGVSKGSIDFERLREADKRRKELSAAMKGFTDWITPEILSGLAERKSKAFDLFCNGNGHMRTPNVLADLLVGVELFGEFAVSCGALSVEEAEIWRVEAIAALNKAGAEHVEAVAANNPADAFIDALRAGFDAGAFYVRERLTGVVPEGGNARLLGWETVKTPDGWEIAPVRGAEFVGWVDKKYLCLDPENAYRAINQRGARGGTPLGLSKDALWKLLKEKGYLIPEYDKQTGAVKRLTPLVKVKWGEDDSGADVKPTSKRVVQIERSRVIGV